MGPLVHVYVYGAVPPVLVAVTVIATPTQVVGDGIENVMFSGAFWLIKNVCVMVQNVIWSVTVTVCAPAPNPLTVGVIQLLTPFVQM